MDEETGVVRTRCAASSLKTGHEYEIGVSAVDLNGETAPLPQKSPTQSVKILVGERDPQFHELQYVASVAEGSPAQFKLVCPHCYTLYFTNRSTAYRIFSFFQLLDQELISCSSC